MPPMRVVPAFDEIENGKRSLALRCEVVFGKQLAFERCVEALAHRVIVTIADRSHRRRNAGFSAALSKGDRRVLRSLVRMVDDRLRIAPIDRHVERIDDQLFAHMISHRPAHVELRVFFGRRASGTNAKRGSLCNRQDYRASKRSAARSSRRVFG
jgi:hypothetical protein